MKKRHHRLHQDPFPFRRILLVPSTSPAARRTLLTSWTLSSLAKLSQSEIGDRRGEGADLGNLGLAYAALGDSRKAIEYHEQALALAREIGDRRGEGNALWNMSLSLDKLGKRAEAIDNTRLALKIYEQIESPVADRVRQKLAEWEG